MKTRDLLDHIKFSHYTVRKLSFHRRTSFRRCCIALSLLLFCVLLQSLSFRFLVPPPVAPNATAFGAVVAMLVFPLLLLLSKQPQEAPVDSADQVNM